MQPYVLKIENTLSSDYGKLFSSPKTKKPQLKPGLKIYLKFILLLKKWLNRKMNLVKKRTTKLPALKLRKTVKPK